MAAMCTRSWWLRPVRGHQAHPAFAAPRAQAAPLGQGRTALFVIDLLLRPVGPVDDQRQLHAALLFGHLAPDAGHVEFLGPPVFELQAKVALGMGRAGKDHHAGCVAVEPVNQKRLGEGVLKAAQQAIGQMRALAGHRQKPGRLVDDEQFMILVDDVQRHVGGRVFVHAA